MPLNVLFSKKGLKMPARKFLSSGEFGYMPISSSHTGVLIYFM